MLNRLLVLVFSIVSVSTYAASGQASIPHFLVDTGSKFTTYYYISNITASNVNVELDIFRQDGTLFVDGNTDSSGYLRAYGGGFTNYVEAYSETVAFNLGPFKTIILHLTPRTFDAGFGRIRWSQTGSSTEALVANGRVFRMINGQEMSYGITINGGQPF